jgi:hypothetical protein
MKINFRLKLPHFPRISSFIRLISIYTILNREYSNYTGFGRLRDDEEQIHQKYLINDNPQNLKDLKLILENLKTTSHNSKFNLGIDIIQKLLSHHNEEVIASALGNLFFIFNNKVIKNLIIKEIRIRAHDQNPDVRESAQYSLELISGEIHKFESFEKIYGQFSNVLLDLSYNFHLKWKLVANSIIKNNHVSKYLNSMMDYFTKETLVILKNNPSLLLFINEEKIEAFHDTENIDNWLEYYSDMIKFEKIEDPLDSLANVYAMTYLENGHLRKLAAFLDDEDPNVQMMGINGLTYAIKSLLCTNYSNT